jgi:hypothetical protein
VVGVGGDERDQFVQFVQLVDGDRDFGAVGVGADPVHPLGVGVEELQGTQGRRDLVQDDELVAGLGRGESAGPQIVGGVLPVADHRGGSRLNP